MESAQRRQSHELRDNQKKFSLYSPVMQQNHKLSKYLSPEYVTGATRIMQL